MRVFWFAVDEANQRIIQQKLDVLGHETIKSIGDAQAMLFVFDANSFHLTMDKLAAIMSLGPKQARIILVQADSGPVRIHGALSITCAPVELDTALKYTGTPE